MGSRRNKLEILTAEFKIVNNTKISRLKILCYCKNFLKILLKEGDKLKKKKRNHKESKNLSSGKRCFGNDLHYFLYQNTRQRKIIQNFRIRKFELIIPTN